MRINHILFFLGLFFLTSCVGKSTPDGIIPRDRMVGLLVQVHIVDGSLINLTQVPDTLYKHGISKYLHLFKTYGTDTTQFKKSLIYYANNSEVYDKMYDDIVKILTAKTDSLNKIKTALVKKDSLKNVLRTKKLKDSLKKAQDAAAKGLQDK